MMEEAEEEEGKERRVRRKGKWVGGSVKVREGGKRKEGRRGG